MRSTLLQAQTPETGAPRVWVLADDRPGHRTQVVGLAQSLGWDYEVKDLRFTVLNRISNRLLGASLLGLDRARSTPLQPPWPDLVIAMGRRSAPIARWIGTQGGEKTRLVQLGRKGADSADPFDLSVTCAHFRLPTHARRLVITVPITQVTPEKLSEEADRWQGLFQGPKPHIAVLVGGTTAQHRLNRRVAERLASDALSFAEQTGGTLHIVTSRRTGAKATAMLRRVAGARAHVHEWSRDAVQNPYLGYLALADVLIVTGESESMLAEAAATGKTLYVYPIPEKPDTLKRRYGELVLRLSRRTGLLGLLCAWMLDRGLVRPPRRLEEMHAALYRTGTANQFGIPLNEARRAALPDTAAIVARVRSILEAATAPRLPAAIEDGMADRLGFVARSDTRTIWFQGRNPEDFARMRTFTGLLQGRFPRVGIVFLTDRPDVAAHLSREHPDIRCAMTPWPVADAAHRMAKRLNPRLILLLGDRGPADGQVIRAAGLRHVPVLRLGPDPADAGPQEPGVEGSLSWTVPPPRLLERVGPLLHRDLKQRRSESAGPLHPYSLGTAFLHSAAGRAIVDRRYRRIGGIDALRDALGRPETILCLGNGPSSEHPALKATAYDALFRVNERWLDRGVLTAPDMVFTGDQKTVARVRGAIFGFKDEAAADRLKLQRKLGLSDPPLRYVLVDELDTFLGDMDLPVVPTNGATMLATAVALAPKRLIIGGIDLFLDPRGGYPGDPETANSYTPRHDREVEVHIIRRALDLYQGEVTILSDVLAETLAGPVGTTVVEGDGVAVKDATGR